ncbi:MAG: AI-2E family transporter [Clostridium sp.]|nr:AI-2E family transporter [Clostridium sp.]MDY5483577.1 AI-2E family transporter [Clostridium sp.]
MEKKNFKDHLFSSMGAAVVILLGIMFWHCIQNWEALLKRLSMICGILAPIVYGGVLAYLVSPVYNGGYRLTGRCLKYISKDQKSIENWSKIVATLLSLLFVFAVIMGMFRLLIPQLLDSLLGIKEAFPTYISNLYFWVQKTLEDNPQIEAFVMDNLQSTIASLQVWAEKLFVDIDMKRIGEIVTGVSSSVIGLVNFISNWFIGLIVMVYLLNIKDVLTAQGKKIIYGIFRMDWANGIVEELRFVNRVFGGFILGKILDSVLIGIICYAAVSLMKMPFPTLLSVIIGVTNVIPFFGPFIGAIPTGILVFLVSPIKCVYFLIWILLMQQFDGNILGPRILGDSTGLPSFWVLFSILLFGGLFGFIGMIIAVPMFAVIYDLIGRAVHHALRKKKLPTATEEYKGLDHIDESSGKLIR